MKTAAEREGTSACTASPRESERERTTQKRKNIPSCTHKRMEWAQSHSMLAKMQTDMAQLHLGITPCQARKHAIPVLRLGNRAELR